MPDIHRHSQGDNQGTPALPGLVVDQVQDEDEPAPPADLLGPDQDRWLEDRDPQIMSLPDGTVVVF